MIFKKRLERIRNQKASVAPLETSVVHAHTANAEGLAVVASPMPSGTLSTVLGLGELLEAILMDDSYPSSWKGDFISPRSALPGSPQCQ